MFRAGGDVSSWRHYARTTPAGYSRAISLPLAKGSRYMRTITMCTPSAPKLPRLDGSLFFPDLISFHMQNNPTLPMWVYPDGQGVTEITFLEFGRAAHRIAYALRPERTGDDRQVVMLIANTDTIYYLVVVAGMSIAGLVVSGSSLP